MSRWLRLADDAGIVELPFDAEQQPEGLGPLEPGSAQPPDEAQHERITYLARMPHGPIITLTGTAQVVWSEAQAGPLDDLAERVAARFGVPSAEIAGDVRAFVDELLEAQVADVVEVGADEDSAFEDSAFEDGAFEDGALQDEVIEEASA